MALATWLALTPPGTVAVTSNQADAALLVPSGSLALTSVRKSTQSLLRVGSSP